VEEDVIALSEVYEVGSPYIKDRCRTRDPGCVRTAELEVLDSLIQRELMRQELVRLDADVKGEDVDDVIDQTLKQYDFPDREALRAEVERGGMTWDAYRSQLTDRERVQRFQQLVLAPRVHVPDDEMRDLYQRTVRDVGAKEEVTLSSFKFEIPRDAPPEERGARLSQLVAIIEDLNAGRRDWAATVAEFGGPTQIDGKITEGSLNADLETIAFGTEVGRVGDPVVLGSYAFVMKVEGKGQSADVAPFEAVADRLRAQIFERKMEDALDEWYEVARRDAVVNILLPAIAGGARPTGGVRPR
jgi:parvulin-like peptidyl-prolyl isomerase